MMKVPEDEMPEDGNVNAGLKTVDAVQWASAIEVLQREYRDNLTSRSQLVRFWIFSGCAYLSVVAFVLAIGLAIIAEDSDLGGFFVAVFGISFLLALVLGLTLIPFFLRVGRTRRLISTLGVEVRFEDAWEQDASRRRLRNRMSLGAVVVVVALFVLGAVATFASPDSSFSGEVLLGFVVVAWSILLVASAHIVRRAKNRSDAIANLEDSWRSYAPGPESETVAVPIQDYQSVARLEQDQIKADRARVVGENEVDKAYAVLLSKKARRVLDGLAPFARNQVLLSIDSLATAPNFDDFEIADPSTGLLRASVADIDAEVLFSVDEDLIRIFDVRRRSSPGLEP